MRIPLTSVLIPTFVGVILNLLNVCKVDAVNCYKCSSAKDVHCNEEIDVSNTNIPLSDCSDIHDARYCIKTTGIYNGEMGTTRFCASENLGNICDFQKRKGDVRAYRGCIFTCKSDGCNGSSSTVASLLFVAVFSLFTWFLS